MTRVERRRLRIQLLLGTLLAVTAVALDGAGQLDFLERRFYDLRARYCQFFAGPADPPVHLDIDQNALDAIPGGWPWPRAMVGRIIDELYAAGAKAVALDVIFQEPKPEQDALLAQSLRQGGGAQIAVLLSLPESQSEVSPIAPDLEAALFTDLELSVDVARERFGEKARAMKLSDREFVRAFLDAQSNVLYRRIDGELDKGPADLKTIVARLLPDDDPTVVSTAERLIAKEYARVLAVRELRRFGRPVTPGMPKAWQTSDDNPPSLALSRAAGACGFVNYRPDDDGIVRAVPLLVECRGYLLPQMGLALACKSLGVKLDDLRITETSITIPREPAARDIVIPVRRRDLSEAGRVPLCMDVPMFGTHEWQTLYDRPRRGDVKRRQTHVSAALVWEIFRNENIIRSNNAKADVQVLIGLEALAPEDAEGYKALDPSLRPREAMIDRLLKEIPAKIEEYGNTLAEHPENGPKIEALAAAQGQVERVRLLAGANRKTQAVVDESRNKLRDLVKGRAALFGWVAAGSMDNVPTPLHDKCPGVVVHGAIYNAIMGGETWQAAPLRDTIAITLFLGFLSTLAVARMSPPKGLATVLGLNAAYLAVNGLLLFDYADLLVGVAGPVVASMLVWSGLTLVKIVTEISERSRITRRFQSYVDPTLVNFVVEHPEQAGFEGREVELTVLFTDLQGFTTLSERLKEKSVKVISQYMEVMVPVIRRHGGYVNKFLGDGIMAFFGAPADNPRHAAAAIEAVLDMQDALEPFNARLAGQGLPTLKMRAGISTGTMIVGDAGPSFASDYTVLGDRVNLAARLESANKATGTSNLMTKRTVELAGDAFLVRPVGKLRVVGKDESVEVYEVLGLKEKADARKVRLAELTGQMVNAFQGKGFNDCCAAVDRLEAEFGESALTALYREQCKVRCADPELELWDGHIALGAK